MSGHALLDILRHPFDDDDRVVDDDADCQDEGEQGRQVDRVTQRRHAGERPDDCNRDRCRRHQGCTKVLQEYQDHDQHQQPGLPQGFVDLGDRVLDEDGGVIRDAVMQSGRESARKFRHLCRNCGGNFERIGVGRLVDGDPGRRLAVQLEVLRIGLRAEFDARHILDLDEAAALRSLILDDDFAELARIAEPREDVDRVLELLVLRRRRHADLSRRHFLALFLDGQDHVFRREVKGIELLRIHPNPHRILARAHHRDVAYTGQARQLVDEVDRRVIPHEEGVARPVR